MNIEKLMKNATFTIEPVIDVFVCDTNECRITIDVTDKELSPNSGDLNFAAIVNIEIDVDDRKLLLEQLKKEVSANTLKFAPYAETALLEKFNQDDSQLDADLELNHQEEFESPYSIEVNEQLTSLVVEMFNQNKFEITYI